MIIEAESSSATSSHSYPPTPTALSNDERSFSFGTSRSGSISQIPVPSQITQFVLAPSSLPPMQQQQTSSFFARAFSILKSHQPSHSNSFTLSRLLAPNPLASPPPYAYSVPPTDNNAPLPLHPPLLVFLDRTPFLTVRSLTGLIEIDDTEEQLLGVDTSFWIAIVLTYLEFLEEREVSDITSYLDVEA
jgi:hypothetical protein